jgi:integrase
MTHFREAVSEEESPYLRGLFVLYVLTGVRKIALARIKWSHVDIKAGTLSVYQTKAKRDLHVPLSQEAIEVLKQIPRTVGSEYVFAGPSGHIHSTAIERAWLRIKERTKAKGSNIDDVRIHDLRRTFGSWLASNGVSIATIMELMDITQHATAKVYMRFQQQALRDAVNLVGSKIVQSK